MPPSNFPQHIDQNIKTITDLRHDVERRTSRHQRAIDVATDCVLRPATLYCLLTVVLSWVTYNLLAPDAGWAQWDAPPFFWLQGATTLYAAFVSTMVLTTQNRQARENERRSMLELQVNLLSEQKTTKIIALLEELRRDLPNVTNREDLVAEAMQVQVDPHAVVMVLESTMRNSPPETIPGDPSHGRLAAGGLPMTRENQANR